MLWGIVHMCGAENRNNILKKILVAEFKRFEWIYSIGHTCPLLSSLIFYTEVIIFLIHFLGSTYVRRALITQKRAKLWLRLVPHTTTTDNNNKIARSKFDMKIQKSYFHTLTVNARRQNMSLWNVIRFTWSTFVQVQMQ